MARTRRRRGGVEKAVKRTVRRVGTTARRRAPAAGGDLMKAVQSLVKALPVGELEKRLAGLEKTVARLEVSLRGAAKRATTAVRGSKRTTAKRATAKRTTAKRATAKRATAKRATAKRATAKRATAKRAGAKKTTARKTTARKTARKTTARKTTARKTTA